MAFNTGSFLLYFLPSFLLVYLVLPQKARNYWALLCSILFLSWGAPIFIFVALASIVSTFLFTKAVHHSSGKRRIFWLSLSVALNLAILVYYKYTNFFLDTSFSLFAGMGWTRPAFLHVALPLGVSFITFHQLSYTLDVHRGTRPPLHSIADYALYVLLFPRLIAGPILQYAETAEQLSDRKAGETIDNRLSGLFRFSLGLAKKVLIADVLGSQLKQVFDLPVADLSTPYAWIGILGFSFQIYFDFSAYSDMAIGIGRMMGFRFPENFNMPYASTSITDFWRRWHMTLSAWLREYLYMPLAVGMRERGRIGVFIALMITFTLCGMWHDAGWNFILWGALQGLLLVADQIFMLKFLKRAGRLPAVLLTFFAVVMGWVLFRMGSLHDISAFYAKLFGGDMRWCDVNFNAKFWFIFALAAVFSFVGFFPKIGTRLSQSFNTPASTLMQTLQTLISLILLLLSISAISAYGFNPFIYARF
jgi:alginate O-acetyltransferase complex protein AlgI